MKIASRLAVALALFVIPFAAACGNGTADATQTPPQGKAAVEAWLTAGDYKAWHCEAKEHAARSPSPHMINRICSNEVLAAAGAGAVPEGSSGVKELYDKVGGKIIGYAVSLKTAADSSAGASWYWYERNPAVNPMGDNVVADGLGTSGNPKDVCVGCHVAANSDAAHPGHGDFVYTQVP